MRFALRNRTKITDALGEEAVHRIEKSLTQHFAQPPALNPIPIKVAKEQPYPLLLVDDAEAEGHQIALYIIKKQYDVYTLAFKEFINQQTNTTPCTTGLNVK